MIRVERVDPCSFAGEAGRVLRDSWPPPSLHYTSDYILWQFGFPSDWPPVAVAAFDGEEAVGFAATVPRRLRLGATAVAVEVLSFVSVRPRWRGRGVGEALYAVLLGEHNPRQPSVVAFAQPGSAGRHLLLKSLGAAGYRPQAFGTYRAHGFVTRAHHAQPVAACEEPSDPACFLEVALRCDHPSTLWDDPGREQLDHDLRDPRGRRLVTVRSPQGSPIGAATVVLAEILTARGLERVPMVERVFMPEASADGLRAVFRFAAGHCGAGGVPAPVVTAPNLWGFDAGTLKSAGLRASPSCFEGYLFTLGETNPYPGVEGTNLEIL